MVTVLPSKDMKIIEKCRPETDNAEALVSKEKGIELGYICVEQTEKGKLEIIGMELYYCGNTQSLSGKDRLDGELLVRAAGSYALNRNLWTMECGRKELVPLLCQLGFQQIDGMAKINLNQLFNVCKN